MIDRIGPTVRPMQAPRGHQRWRHLLFMHWPVPVHQLRPLVPTSLQLDLYDGTAYVGVVPFQMYGVRPAWWPEKLALAFLETNVRTYVYCGNQPGVYFFSLEAASWLAVHVARQVWGLPYHHADMEMRRVDGEICCSSLRRQPRVRHSVRYRIGPPLGHSLPGSLEFFFLERYLLFVQRRSRLLVGQVHHRPYPAQSVEIIDVHDELVAATGLSPVQGPPAFAHYVAGVDVEIHGLRSV